MAQERAKVPVVNIKFERLKKLVSGVKMNTILDTLPFVGVDIEDIGKDRIRIEYNPNRPDLSSDYGMARALRGLLDIETGLPKFKLAGRSGMAVSIEDAAAIRRVRPYVVALVAKNGKLDEETLKQLIAMQEDLHNGVGRKRRKASIGIHNLDVIRFPVTYKTVSGGDYSFIPLNESSKFSIYQILKDLEIGRQYGHIVSAFDQYPIIIDRAGTVLSLPPIINGQATKVDCRCRNLFVEVTATDQEIAEDVLAILAITLYDAGFEIRTVSIVESGSRRGKIETPRMKPKLISIDVNYVNNILGIMLDTKQMITCLKRSRLDAKAVGRNKIICAIPRYRTDISDPIDISEEVAIGYGIYNLKPKFPTSPTAGNRGSLSVYFNRIGEAMIGLGMIESLNFMLTSKAVQYNAFDIPARDVLSVESSRSAEHEILRNSLVPLLLQSLSYNIHEQYPQRLFEIGKTFIKSTATIEERWSLAAVIAHTDADYTEIKSTMQALLRSCYGKEATTKASTHHMFMEGRCADVILDGKSVGTLGEIVPLALENFKLRTPVAAFEINLLALIQDKKYNTM